MENKMNEEFIRIKNNKKQNIFPFVNWKRVQNPFRVFCSSVCSRKRTALASKELEIVMLNLILTFNVVYVKQSEEHDLCWLQ